MSLAHPGRKSSTGMAMSILQQWGELLNGRVIEALDKPVYIVSANLVGVRDSKSGERSEHARAIFLPLLC